MFVVCGMGWDGMGWDGLGWVSFASNPRVLFPLGLLIPIYFVLDVFN